MKTHFTALISYAFLEAEILDYCRTVQLWAGLNIGDQDLDAYEADWMDRNDSLGLLIDCDAENRYSPNYNFLIGSY